MLEKIILVDKIEIDESCNIHVRIATRIVEDENVLSQSYHRHCLHPGADLTNQDPRVVAVAQALWTPEVIAAAQAAKNSQSSDTTTA